MTTTKDILNVLKSHREIIRVELPSSKDCTEFWGEFRDEVYQTLPDTVIQNNNDEYRIDNKIYQLLRDLQDIDTLEMVRGFTFVVTNPPFPVQLSRP